MLAAIMDRFKSAISRKRPVEERPARQPKRQGPVSRPATLFAKSQDRVHPEDAAAVVAARNETMHSVARAYIEAMAVDDLNDSNTRRVLVI